MLTIEMMILLFLNKLNNSKSSLRVFGFKQCEIYITENSEKNAAIINKIGAEHKVYISYKFTYKSNPFAIKS